jgi:AcrR family transcriptional regulator
MMSAADIKYSFAMARWAPDAAGRLASSALGLFVATTVEEIAAAAGVTERTFFRHFPTKEDVLFTQGDDIEGLLVSVVTSAAPETTPFEIISQAIGALAVHFEPERPKHRQRFAVISSSPSLSERELLKRLHLVSVIVAQFERRGVSRIRAEALAGTALTVFNVGYRTWTTDEEHTPLADRLAHVLGDLQQDLAPVSRGSWV